MTLLKILIAVVLGGAMLPAEEKNIVERVWEGLYSYPVLNTDSANALGDYFDEAAFLSLGEAVWRAAMSEGYHDDKKKASSDFEKMTSLIGSKIHEPSPIFLSLCRMYRHGGALFDISEIDADYLPIKHFVHLYAKGYDPQGWKTFSEDLDLMSVGYSSIVIGLVPIIYQEHAFLYADKLENKTDGESTLSLRESLRILEREKMKKPILESNK
jgi:hypothetical protein